jgi:hypothetical protein
MYVTRV